MVALRSLELEEDWQTGMLVEQQRLLCEQQRRVRLGQCVFCGVSRLECQCGEYEATDDRRDYSNEGDAA